jgi:hypothetical protein
MDDTAVAEAAAAFTAAASVITPWLRSRSRRQLAREASRRDHVSRLPPGSRIVDLGSHGMVIDVGGAPAGAGSERDAAR